MNVADTIGGFVHSYYAKPAGMSDETWLTNELARHGIFDHSEAAAIIRGVESYRHSVKELNDRVERGESRSRYVHDFIEAGAKVSGVVDVNAYAIRIDDAVSSANEMMWKTIHRLDGGVNQAEKLYGNIAEAEIAGSAAINQAASESVFTTRQLRENKLGGADTEVIDMLTGNVVTQQQMKFYQTAEETIRAYDAGGYAARGQTLIAPTDQIVRIRELRPDIKVSDRIDPHSPGVTIDQVKEIQNDAQMRGVVRERGWQDANLSLVSKHILGKAVESGILAIGIQAVSVLGRRAWNAFVGKPNKAFEQDLNEFAEDAAKVGVTAGVTTAVAGGLNVAARNNLLGTVLKNSPAGMISALACAAVENVKILGQLGRGEITTDQALDKSGDNACTLLGALAVGTKFATAGTAILPGVGTVVGAVIGGVVGNTGGHVIYQGAKRTVKAVGSFVSRVASTVSSAARSVWSGVKSLFS